MTKRYPWRLFFRYFFVQVVLFNLLTVTVLFQLSSSSDINRNSAYYYLALFFFGSIVISLISAWRFTVPIWRISRKVMNLASKKMSRLFTEEEDFYEDGDSEYSELDHALERLRRKLKKRKEQLEREREETQAFMSSVQEGLVSFSLDERLLYFNSQFAATFLEPTQMQNTNVFLTNVFRSPEIYEAFQSVKDQGVSYKVTLRMNSRLDGGGRFFSVSLYPLRKGRWREVYGVIGVFYDITDIKKAEQIRIEFVGNASHELRTPLTTVKGYLETLKEDFKAGHLDQVPQFLDIIDRNVERLIELVNDLLSLSSLEHGSQLKLESVNVLGVSELVVKELARAASEKNQMIRVTGEVPKFEADFRKVEQVLMNLVSNSIKYIPQGKTIQIRWERGQKNDVILRVIDDGPGIPEEHHARLFERFYRIDKGRSRDAGGTGLGLAIVKHIMTSHGGSVSVKSSPGIGAEFICIFPQRKSPDVSV